MKDISRYVLEDMIKYDASDRDELHYLFQYRLIVKYNTKTSDRGVVEETIRWIKDNYDTVVDICLSECKVLEVEEFKVSEDEFKETIEPYMLDFDDVTGDVKCILKFKLGNTLQGKSLDVHINKNKEIGEVLMH